MSKLRNQEKLDQLLKRVFEEKLNQRDLIEECAEIFSMSAGSKYPAFVHLLSHFVADQDLRAADKAYDDEMRAKIVSARKNVMV